MAIPFLSTPDKPLTQSTQALLPVADIVDDLVIYKNGGAAVVLESTSLNFGLLSEREQQSVIASYAGLLNSLNFSVQVLVSSQKKDISEYMTFLDVAASKIQNPKLSAIMRDYKDFIDDAIKKKNVLSKRFFIAIPFSPAELGVAKSLTASFKPGSGPLPFPKSYVIRKAKIALYPKRDHFLRQAGRLAIKVKQLGNEDLIRLFYSIYNPLKPVREKGDEY
jgi:hypothetical protein